MPNIEKILQTMKKQEIPSETIANFMLFKTKQVKPEDYFAFFTQMEELLSKEQCLSIMNEQGCRKTAKLSEKHRVFGKIHADKTIQEKIDLLTELDSPHKAPCHLNTDGTLTVYFQYGTKGDYYCPCNPIRNLKSEIMPITYCGCCGGHMRFLYEHAFGVKLKLIEIVSSMANSNGEKPCKFIYEIID